MTDEVVVKDFSKARPKLFLSLDGVRYEARTSIGLRTLQRIQAVHRGGSGGDLGQKLNLFEELFRALLKSDAIDAFLERVNDEDDPVDFQQLEGMIAYLTEFHGLRPTEGPSASPNGSSNEPSGTDSTVGVSPVG